MKATVRTSRVAVPFANIGGVRMMESSIGERLSSRAGETRGVMRRYANNLSQALRSEA